MPRPDRGKTGEMFYTEKSPLSLKPFELEDFELSNSFTSRPVDAKINGITVKGFLPLVTGYHNGSLQKEMNRLFESYFDSIVGSLSTSAKALTFSFETKEFGNYFSFVIYASEQSSFSNHWVRTVNISKTEQKILTVNSVFGPNGVKVVNKFIEKQINPEESKYNTNFKGIDDNAAFYMTDEEMVLLFDKYAIAAGSYGIVEFILPVSSVKNVVIQKDEDYFVQSEYNLKMVKLSEVAPEFGYTLKWTQADETVDVIYQDTIVSSFKLGVNRYQKGKLQARALEMSPELVGDRTYVPLSFFDVILDISYSVNPDGDIVFSAYTETYAD